MHNSNILSKNYKDLNLIAKKKKIDFLKKKIYQKKIKKKKKNKNWNK